MDEFINAVLNEPVNIFLTNGVRLSGSIAWHDNQSLALGLTRDGVTQAVMLHAIATIVPDAY